MTQYDGSNKPVERPPVIAVMGHIDHGKSTLLDFIRKSNVTEKETGGITQHISACEISHEYNGVKKYITFIDTPGHEAFSAIRSRGANIADIAILVVSAEDGVKAQTLEALSFIKNSKTPFIVTITKIDKPNADINKAKQSLAENEIYLEGYGGSIPSVAISAKTGEGIPELLEMVLLMAEMEELKADPSRNAEGFVVEASHDPKKGITATLIIKDGTLKKGSHCVSGTAYVPVRIMEDINGKKISEASFSSPVRLIGWSKIPPTGDIFKSFSSKKQAEQYISECESKQTPKDKKPATGISLEGNIMTVPLVIKADTAGSVEAIEHELQRVRVERVQTKIIHKGVGDITENDLKSAGGCANPIILGFNVGIDSRLGQLPERLCATIKTFDIIYHLTEWLSEELRKRTPRVTVEESKAKVKILKTFSRDKNNHVVGGRVETGILSVGDKVKISRRESQIGEGSVKELQQQKTKVREVEEGKECGMLIDAKFEIFPGDSIESYKLVEK